MIIEKSATPRLDLSKLQDRGNKKWVAMMLPEHVAVRTLKENLNQI